MVRRIAISALLLVTLAHGQWFDTTFRIPDTFGLSRGRPSVARDPDLQVVYVAGDSGNSVLVVDDVTCRPIGRFTVGSSSGVGALVRPSDRPVLFCALVDEDAVIALDCATHQPVSRCDVGHHPGGLLYCGAESRLCVANWGDISVSVVDLSADSVVATIPDVDLVGLAQGMRYVPGLRRAFFASQGDSQVVAVDLASDTVIARIPVGESASALCYNPANNRIYCACWGGALYSIDAADCSIATVLQETTWARSLACDSLRNRVYVPLGSALAVIDGSADTVVARVTGRAAGSWVCIDSKHNKVFVAAGGSFDWPSPYGVTIIDGESFTPGRLLPGPNRPCASGQWEAGGRVFYAGPGVVYVYDGVRCRAVGELSDGCYVNGLAADSSTGKLYCMTSSPPSIMVIDPATNRVLANIPTTSHLPGPVCFNTVDHKVYIGDEGVPSSGIVTVLDGVGDTLLKEIDVGEGPYYLAYNPDDKVVYVTGGSPYPIRIVDGRTDTVIGHVEFDGWPDWLVYNPAQRKLYSDCNDGVAAIDARTNREITRMGLGTSLEYAVLNSSGTRLYGTAFWHDSVFVIDCVHDTLVGAISVPAGNPQAMCYNSIDDKLYVNNEHWDDSGGVTIIDCARGSADAVLPAASRYFYYDRQTDAVYCIGYSSINVVDGQTSRIIWTLPTDLYFAGIASAPGWPCVYAAWNKHGVASGISAIHKAAGPADLAVRARPDAQATVVRGRLDWTGTLAVMYDKCGRRVADVHRGGNDLGRLRPGVYFVRQNDVRRGTYARKVIITR